MTPGWLLDGRWRYTPSLDGPRMPWPLDDLRTSASMSFLPGLIEPWPLMWTWVICRERCGWTANQHYQIWGLSSQSENGDLPPLGQWRDPAYGGGVEVSQGLVRKDRAQDFKGRLVRHLQLYGHWSDLSWWRRREDKRQRILVYPSIHIPTLTYGHELGLGTGWRAQPPRRSFE